MIRRYPIMFGLVCLLQIMPTFVSADVSAISQADETDLAWTIGGGAAALGTGYLIAGDIYPNHCQWCSTNQLDLSLRDDVYVPSQKAAWGIVSDVLMVAAVGAPSLVALGWEINDELWNVISFHAEVIATQGLLTNLIKMFAARPRPYTLEKDPGADLHAADLASFISGHTAAVTAGFMSLALVSDRYGLQKEVSVPLALALGALGGFARMKADRHWLTDVVGGWALGGATAWAIYEIRKVPNDDVATPKEQIPHDDITRAAVQPLIGPQRIGFTLYF